MRMLIVRLIFLLFSHGVHSLAQYPIGSDVNSIKSDNRSLLSVSISINETTESSKVLDDNRVNIQKQIPRDLTVINKTLSDTDSFVSLNNTTDNSNVSDHNDTYTQNKNNTIVTGKNYSNIGGLEKYSNNILTTHGTNITMKTNGENITDYFNKLVNVTNAKTHSNQLTNGTKGSDKLIANSKNSNVTFHTTWKKRHVDQSAARILGQSSYEKNPSIHSEDIKNVLYVKSVNITHDNGEVEDLICTKLDIIPEEYRTSIIRKIDRFIKKTLAHAKINNLKNGDDNNNEEGQDQNDDDDDDDYEDEYDDDDDDDCGCGCRRRRCCRCRKCKRRKCPSCDKIVTPPPESGRRSGATFPINFESSELVVETTTPIETTESPATIISSSIPTLTASSTTSLQFITTSPTSTPSAVTISSTTQYPTTSTTTIPLTTQYPTTSTTIPSTTQYSTTSTSTTTMPTTTTTTASPITSAELLTTKKRNIKRKKCTKKKRRKEESKLLDNSNGNLTMDNDKEVNNSQPNRVPFSGLFENQLE